MKAHFLSRLGKECEGPQSLAGVVGGFEIASSSGITR